METRKFKDLTIRDAFMFAAVMSDPEICRRVLELALGIPISEVHIQTEKTMAYHSEYHGVRLDVYAADADRTRFNVTLEQNGPHEHGKTTHIHVVPAKIREFCLFLSAGI